MNNKSLPKLYSANRETYNFFVARVKDLEIKKFRTRNELAAFIEDIKWPGLQNDGTKPKYSIKGNYQPIIDHLLADGVITEKFDGYRYSYKVKNKSLATPVLIKAEATPKTKPSAKTPAIKTVPSPKGKTAAAKAQAESVVRELIAVQNQLLKEAGHIQILIESLI